MNSAVMRTTGVVRAGRAAAQRVISRTPLRVRLVAASVVLVIAALAAAGVIALATLQSYLTGRVDQQLRAVQQPVTEHQVNGVVSQAGPTRGGTKGRDPDADTQSLPSAYVVEVTGPTGGVLYSRSNLIDQGQPLPDFPHLDGDDTRAIGTTLFTINAVRGDENWRVLATPITLSDGTHGTLLIAESLSDVQNTVNRLSLLLGVIGAGAVVVLAGLGYLIVRVGLRPLRDVERSAARIAAGDLSHRVPTADERTEVGQLSSALNRMLTDIEVAFDERARSEQRMRSFVADASHELRTPLTTIRGFAELYRQGAATSPHDVQRLMTRIEDEAMRMGLLVEDLLLLARLDQERPLAQKPVDLLALATDSVQAARATDPTRPITLTVETSANPPVVIGDEPRLRQVLANLLTNALRHTPAGTPVAVRLVTSDDGAHADDVVVEVRDEGPGMSPEAAARIFERFYRADSHRSRSDGGSGLGLAIVAALVAGHRGSVDVETEPGRGACFRIVLPLAAVSAQPG